MQTRKKKIDFGLDKPPKKTNKKIQKGSSRPKAPPASKESLLGASTKKSSPVTTQLPQRAISLQMNAKDMLGNESSLSFDDMYTLVKPALGVGCYGKVFKCIHKRCGAERAVKIIEKNKMQSQAERLEREINILRSLSHPHLMKLFEYIQDEQNIYLVSELYTGGELFDRIVELKKFTEHDAANILLPILQAVMYLHSQKVVHRDIKPENIMFESKSPNALVKLVDFGTSCHFDTSKLTTRFGTPYYIAPEVLKRDYSEKCDIWSVGVIMYIMLAGKAPFDGKNDSEILEKVVNGVYDPFPLSVSNEAKDLLGKLLEYDQKKRLSAQEACTHPWFKMSQTLSTLEVSNEVFLSLRSFHSTYKLQQAIWLFFVSNLTKEEERESLTSTFKALDLNADGLLSKEELLEYFMVKYGEGSEKRSKREVDALFEAVDIDRNGFIDYSEFVSASLDRQNLLTDTRLKDAFNLFDLNGDGVLSLEEIKKVFNRGKFTQLSEEQWKNMISEVDKNSDLNIDFEEFKEMMSKFLTRNSPNISV